MYVFQVFYLVCLITALLDKLKLTFLDGVSIGLVGSIFIIIFIKFVYNFRGRIHSGDDLIKTASELGKMSLQIYVMQRLFLECFGMKFKNF